MSSLRKNISYAWLAIKCEEIFKSQFDFFELPWQLGQKGQKDKKTKKQKRHKDHFHTLAMFSSSFRKNISYAWLAQGVESGYLWVCG